MVLKTQSIDRRSKRRFDMQRDLRYKVTGNGIQPAAGSGKTINLGSGGIRFAAEHTLKPGCFLEVSINWPVLLGATCPMRLIVFGRVLRASGQTVACTIDKYEFRTSGRSLDVVPAGRSDGMLQRWAAGMKKDMLKVTMARA